MADELDKFVLQYIVEQKEAIKRLEALNNKVETTTKKARGAKDEFKDFAKGASDEIGKMVPGIDKVSGAIRLLGGEVAIAAAAIGVLAIGVTAVMNLRERFGAQRKQARDIGVGDFRLEEYQRKFSKASGGTITREQTAQEIQKIAEFSSAIRQDPTRIGQEARTARVLGLDVGAPGTKGPNVNEFLTQIGEKFSKMSDAQVQANATILGINKDFALSLKKQGGTVGEVTEQTQDELDKRKNAQEQLSKFNAALDKLSENFTKAENILGEKLLPTFTRFVQFISDLSNKLPKATEKHSGEAASGFLSAFGLPGVALSMGLGLGPFKGGVKKEDDAKEALKGANDSAKAAAASSALGAKNAASGAKSLSDRAKKEDEINAEARAIADQERLAINQFVGAVASFANAVDEKQAWAAWAGEIGKAAGLGSNKTLAAATSATPSLAPVTKATGYDEFFKAAGEKYGVDPAILKNISKVESGFNPKAVSPVGAEGLMQLMRSNQKSLGVTNPFDPEQNIMGGAKLFSQYLGKAGGDVRKALTFYHGGFDQSKWGPLTAAYPDKVLGAGGVVHGSAAATGVGESRNKIQLRSVQNTIAQRLGVPVGQLQLGGINRGDVGFATSQLEGGIRNQIFGIQNQLKAVNLPQQTRSKLMTELREQQSGLMQLRKFGGEVESAAQPGERSITIGERAIIINVNGADDPNATATTIQAHLGDHMGELVNGTSTGMKY